MSRLRDCAHCGGHFAYIASSNLRRKPYDVFCPDCGYSTARYRKVKDAIKAWNDGKVDDPLER